MSCYYKYNPISLVVEEGITSIGAGSFYRIFSITNVSLPSTLTTIGVAAFRNTNLTSVRIPNGVISIYESAFQDLENMVMYIYQQVLFHWK